VDASIQNTGPDPAENAVMTLTLPSEVSFSSATGGGTHDASPTGGVVTWDLSTLAVSGTPTTYTATVTIAGGTTGIITHTVDVTSTTADPGVSPNQATANTTVALPPEAELAAGASAPTTAMAGTNIDVDATVGWSPHP
jgi:hypothetical protein